MTEFVPDVQRWNHSIRYWNELLALVPAQAKTALAAAQAAEQAAEAEVASEEASQQTMFAQLASLKNTTAEVEAQFQKGVDEANAAAGIPALPAGAIGAVIAFAERQLGKRYVIDGSGPNVWDCSGLTMVAWQQVGVDIGGHGSTMQYNYMSRTGKLVYVGHSTANMRPGDLIFYADGGSPDASVKYHVTIYIGNGLMVEAPNPTTVVRIHSVYYQNSDMVPYVGRPLG